MTAPAGAIVRLYVDLLARVEADHIIRTQSGRRYRVLTVRVQARGKHAGRQHLVCSVLGPGDLVWCVGETQGAPSNRECMACGERGQACDQRVHDIRWYTR